MPDHRSESLFLQSTNDTSGRLAVLDEVEGSVWLYLMPRGGEQPEFYCWLANTLALDEQPSLVHYQALNLPPPAESEFVTPGCVLLEPSNHAWEFRWSADGESVAALCDNNVRGFICAWMESSYAYHIRADCPWGRAWSQRMFDRRFKRIGK